MPYAYDPFLDEEKKEQGGAPQIAGASQVIGGSSQTAPSGGTPKGPTSSDRFMNLNSYLDANQGNQFGQNFAQKVQGEVAKGQEAQTQGGAEFRNKVNQSTIAANPALVNSAVSNPTGFVGDSQSVEEFKKQRDAQYKGPNTFADSGDTYQKAFGATKKATDVTQSATSEPGRFALLNNYFGRPEYSQGQKSLDNLLVSGDKTAMSGIEQARKNAQELAQNFQNQNKELSGYAAQGRGTTEATRMAARDALGIDGAGNRSGKGAIGSLQTELDSALQSRGSELDKINEAARNRKFSEIDPSIKALFDELGGTYGVDPGAYLQTVDRAQLNQGTVASPEQQAKMRALASLADITNPIDIPGAGSLYGKDLYSFNKAGFTERVGNEKAAFSASNKALQEEMAPIAKNIDDWSLAVANAENMGLQGTDRYNSLVRQLNEFKAQQAAIQARIASLYQSYGMDYAQAPKTSTTTSGGGIAGM